MVCKAEWAGARSKRSTRRVGALPEMRGIRLRMGRWDRRMHMQGVRIHELTVETVAGISGHALSGQKRRK